MIYAYDPPQDSHHSETTLLPLGRQDYYLGRIASHMANNRWALAMQALREAKEEEERSIPPSPVSDVWLYLPLRIANTIGSTGSNVTDLRDVKRMLGGKTIASMPKKDRLVIRRVLREAGLL